MRIQHRDGGVIHWGTRKKSRGGYNLDCRSVKPLVSFADYKRVKGDINCVDCVVIRRKRKEGVSDEKANEA